MALMRVNFCFMAHVYDLQMGWESDFQKVFNRWINKKTIKSISLGF